MKASPFAALAIALLLLAFPAAAQPASDAPIRATIARYYEELAKKEKGRLDELLSPHFIDASPHYHYAKTGAAHAGPRVFSSLPAQALKFAYEIEEIRRDANFARVQVWERGYFYAWAAQKTYERAADTDFILERSAKDGRWRIAAHQSGSYGIPPHKITDPMPDLRALYYATEGKDRDPAKDAEAAKNF